MKYPPFAISNIFNYNANKEKVLHLRLCPDLIRELRTL